MTLADYSSLATIGASLLVVIQLAVGVFVYLRQIKRERVIATLDYFEGANKELKEAKRELRKKIGSEITPDAIKGLESNPDGRLLLHQVLNAYERLAAGLNLGVYDLPTIARINGKVLVSNYERFRPYIEHRRKTSNPNAWIEFSRLAERICGIRKELRIVPDDPND